MDLDPPLPRGNLFLSSTSSYSVRSAKFCEVLRVFAKFCEERKRERERDGYR